MSVYAGAVSKTRPKRYTNWYVRDWMKACDITQAELAERMDLNKTTVSHLVNNQIDYTPEYIRDVAKVLNIAPYELLLHPKDAFDLRRLMADASTAADLGRRIRLVTDRTGTDG